jgi:hypothetical protein
VRHPERAHAARSLFLPPIAACPFSA